MRPTLKLLLFALCAWLAGRPLSQAQTEPVRSEGLDREKWEELTRDIDYPLPQEEWEEDAVQRPPAPSEGWLTFFKALAVVAAIGIIAFIIAQLQSGDSLFGAKNRKLGQGLQINLENIEENLPDADIPDFIRNAIRSGDFKMAVRLHYLGAIQSLARRGWIRWERDKTNGDYLQEIAARPVFDGFRETTLIFERVWYGNRALEEVAYRRIADRFAELEQQIQKT